MIKSSSPQPAPAESPNAMMDLLINLSHQLGQFNQRLSSLEQATVYLHQLLNVQQSNSEIAAIMNNLKIILWNAKGPLSRKLEQ